MRSSLAVALLLLGVAATASAEDAKAKPDPFAALRPFEGRWRGTGSGEPGEATVERSYGFVLGKRFLEVRNRSSYAPKAVDKPGEVHEDLGYFSHDRARGKLVLRQFHVEGFVNQYVLERASPDGKELVFVTEAIENIPPGYRARETYRLRSADEIEELFELAAPGKEFEPYSRTRLMRVK